MNARRRPQRDRLAPGSLGGLRVAVVTAADAVVTAFDSGVADLSPFMDDLGAALDAHDDALTRRETVRAHNRRER